MIKKTLYPKTKRLGAEKAVITITEKIDGSNLTFFKFEDELYIAQRNNIYTLTEGLSTESGLKNVRYKHLYDWLDEHGEDLKNELNERSAISGEWIAMGRINYGEPEHRFLQFAKGRIDDNMDLQKINYNHELFKWSFIEQEVPSYIGEVPVVAVGETVPTAEELDELYTEYSHDVEATENRPVEGFVVAVGSDSITKYVRFKDGQLKDHFVWGGK